MYVLKKYIKYLGRKGEGKVRHAVYPLGYEGDHENSFWKNKWLWGHNWLKL